MEGKKQEAVRANPKDLAAGAFGMDRTTPILRMFDVDKARAFYLDYLGFEVEFEHRYATGMPLYMGLCWGALKLHLSEHHGDACPGATVFIQTVRLDALQGYLAAKPYPYARPHIVDQGWGRTLELSDPFGNRLRFADC